MPPRLRRPRRPDRLWPSRPDVDRRENASGSGGLARCFLVVANTVILGLDPRTGRSGSDAMTRPTALASLLPDRRGASDPRVKPEDDGGGGRMRPYGIAQTLERLTAKSSSSRVVAT